MTPSPPNKPHFQHRTLFVCWSEILDLANESHRSKIKDRHVLLFSEPITQALNTGNLQESHIFVSGVCATESALVCDIGPYGWKP